MHNLNNWKPGVSKSILLLNAGLLWIGAAIVLDGFSYSWLKHEQSVHVIVAVSAGFLGALIIHHFGFLKVVNKNIVRILPKEGKQCVFSFFSWKSYLLIAVMVSFGYLLRHSSIPRIYLAVIYSGIGTALLLSSIRYLRYFINLQKNSD